MGLIDLAKADIAAITSDSDGPGIAIQLEAPGAVIADVVGTSSTHHLAHDTDGVPMNIKNAHVSIAESVIIAANAAYPIRNDDDEVAMIGHLVRITESDDVERVYSIEENFADQTIGLIVFILGDSSEA